MIPYLVAVWLLGIGIYGVVTSRHLVHLAICLSVAQSGTYVLLLAIGYHSGSSAPVLVGVSPHARTADPVVQALTFVDVVVEAVVTALILALAVQARKRYGTVDPDRISEMRG
jgi:multicomponent Na+:H+ antiporter subunit C